MKKTLLLLIIWTIIGDIIAQQKKIYIAPDDHTDYMWTNTEEAYNHAFLEMLDYYIRLNDSTSDELYPYQSKWNCDGSFWIYTYRKNRNKEQFGELIRQIREGKITVPLNTLAGLHGMAPAEATIRQMYYAGSLEREYGLDLNLVLSMEDQVLPLGLSSLWTGAGAKYSWRGVCACATRVKGFSSRPHEIYWYKGLDDQQVLMKWYSLKSNNQNLGGYAEARDPALSVKECSHLMESKEYPYFIAGAFGKGWDDLKTITAEFPVVAKQFTDENHQVIVSNEIDFFTDFEQNYGKELPSETISYGSTEWGIGVASMAEVSASVKRAMEKLRAAEGLYTLVALKDNTFAANLSDMKDNAWIACGLFFEHNWTADGPITRKQRADWQRKMALQLTAYVDTLYNLSQARMGELISAPGKNQEAFYVYNPLSWSRSDYCDYSYNGQTNISVVDQVTSQNVPFQFITKKGKTYLRILADDIPSMGYKVFIIKKETSNIKNEPAAKALDGLIENDFYKITFTSLGTITSLVDKKDHNRECISQVNGLFANDLGFNGKSVINSQCVRIENAGPVSVTLVAESYNPIKHTSKITLFKNSERIELENYITQNFSEKPVTYSFSFNLTHPEIRHEEAGAILIAKPVSAGGHYADSNCRLDWLALNHFADISGDGRGMILSNRDAYFMKPGNSNVENLDYSTPQINILAGGQIDKDAGLGIENQDGDSYFEDFFALKPYSDGYNSTASMKFAMEHQNPLIAGKITGKSKNFYGLEYSLFTISDPNVLVWSAKPAEEGIDKGVILRVWNMNDKDADCEISSAGKIENAKQTTHIETDIEPITTASGLLKTNIGHNRIETFRVFFK
jgi:alpha-mannosidase